MADTKGAVFVSDKKPDSDSSRQHLAAGLFLIGIGLLLLAERQGWLQLQHLISYWPAIIGVVGLSQMIGARNADQMSRGGLLVFLSAWLYVSLENLWGLSFYNSWPLVLIAVGLGKVFSGLAKTGGSSEDKSAP